MLISSSVCSDGNSDDSDPGQVSAAATVQDLGGALRRHIWIRGWPWIHHQCTFKGFRSISIVYCVIKIIIFHPVERHVLAAADGQVRGQLVCAYYRHNRVHPHRVDVWIGAIPHGHPVHDRAALACLGHVLVHHVAVRDSGGPVFHPVLQLGRIQTSFLRYLRLSGRIQCDRVVPGVVASRGNHYYGCGRDHLRTREHDGEAAHSVPDEAHLRVGSCGQGGNLHHGCDPTTIRRGVEHDGADQRSANV